MSRRRPRTASVGNRSDLSQITPALGIVPLRPSPAPATIVQNLAASLIGNIQEDIRCACHIGKTLYTGDIQGTILRWNPLDASRASFFDGLGAPVNVVVGVNEDKDIWAGLASGDITILNLGTQNVKGQMIHAHDAAVNCIAAGIQCAWSGGDDFLIKKWDTEGVELFAYNHHHGFIKDLLVLRDDPAGSHVRLWGASSDAIISVASLQDNRAQHTLLSDIKMLSGQGKGVSALCLVGADAIWSGFEDGSIGVWSSLGVLRKQVQQAHKGPVGSFAVMGAHVWSGSGDHTVLVWESSSCQLLFSLGDHGGFVKSMVRVDYMCWIFASGKNIRIWCAQSVWDTYEGERDRLNRNLQRLKESLEKAQRDKQSLESVGKKSQQEIQAAQQQLSEQRSTGDFALDKRNAEIEKLKGEHAKTLEVLEAAEENAGDLDEEIKTLQEKLSKLKAEKEAGEKAAKARVQDLEKELGGQHKKASEDLAALKRESENLKTELRTAQGDLENSRSSRENLLANLNQKAEELEKSLKTADDRNEKLEYDLAQSRSQDKEDAQKAGAITQGYEEDRKELERKIKQLQEDLDRTHESANANLKAKDAETQKHESDLKTKIKELKKALKESREDKRRSAKELEELKVITVQLKSSQDASSSAEAANKEKLASLALEVQKARDDLRKALIDKAESLDERDEVIKTISEDRVKVNSVLQQALTELQAKNGNWQKLMKESEKDAGATKEAYEQALKALEDELKKTKTVLADASKARDEAGNDVAGLSEKLQELEQNLTQLKGSAAASDASSEALAKERDDLFRRWNDASSEIEKLKDELSQHSQSGASLASALEEIKNTGEKRLDDLQTSERNQSDLEKRLDEEQKKYSEQVAKLLTALGNLTNEKAKLEEFLVEASAEMEKLRADNASEVSTAQISQEINQLKKERVALQEKLAQNDAELERVKQDLNQIKKQNGAEKQELEQIRKHYITMEKKLAQKTAECEQALQQRSSQQDTSTKMSKEIEDLQAQKVLWEDKLSSSIREIEELKKAKRSQEHVAAQKAAESGQMVSEMGRLYFEIKQKEDEYRQAKENAILAAAEAARRIAELQNKIARLEMKLEDVMPKPQVAASVEDPVWARIRELETALMQAHVDYRLLNQEFQRMRGTRTRHRNNQAATDGKRQSSQTDGLDVALKMMQPGFCIDYTKLKVSSAGNQGRVVKNIEVAGHTSSPGTPGRIIAIRPTKSSPETPQRIISIGAPSRSPAPEVIEPIVSQRQSQEKERYFPSHGPMRVRRGLSPGREQ